MKQIYGDTDQHLKEVTFEIPLAVPYLANQEHFQTVNTTFEKDGKYYRAIKQRYQNDTLQVIAVRDTSLQVLDTTVKKWISSIVNDNEDSGSDSQIAFKLFVKDYIPSYIYSMESFSMQLLKDKKGEKTTIYYSPFFLLLTPPPQLG